MIYQSIYNEGEEGEEENRRGMQYTQFLTESKNLEFIIYCVSFLITHIEKCLLWHQKTFPFHIIFKQDAIKLTGGFLLSMIFKHK